MDVSLSQEVALTVVTLLQKYSSSTFETIKQNTLLALCATVTFHPTL